MSASPRFKTKGAGRLRSALASAAALALIVGIAAPASATTLEHLSMDNLRSKAGAIVVARVLSSQGVWTGAAIETETLVVIEEAYRGPASGTLLVRTDGGQIDGWRMMVRGAPSFAPDELVLLFLYRSGENWRPVGMFQGVWRLDAEQMGMANGLDSIAWPSRANGALLVGLSPGPYAVDGGPRLVATLVGERAGRRPLGPGGVIQ